MIEVQDIFARYAESFLQNHKVSIVQYKALNDIINCRTAKLGGHVDNCPECGFTRISYNSCRNRHCPKCQTLAKERWIESIKADLLNVKYFHVVFTLPQELNMVIYNDQKNMYNLMFKCVSETICKLAADKKYLGAQVGLTTVLHTWGQNLCFHPHIHCIVAAGGLTVNNEWVDSKKNFFLPVKVLSRKFKGKFLALLKQQKPNLDPSIFNICYDKEWVVYCKPPFKTAGSVVEYLGRYTHRVAISNNRILKLENGQVTFKWRDYKDSSSWKEMTITAEEFIRRFLMHVLPRGFTKIRHFGFLSSRGKQTKLLLCKKLTHSSLIQKEKLNTEKLLIKILGRDPNLCPKCGFSGLIKTGLAPPVA